MVGDKEQITIVAHEKFELIKNMEFDRGKVNIVHLCKIAGVSRSGYYNYFSEKAIKQSERREKQDRSDFELIGKFAKTKRLEKVQDKLK